MQPVFDVYVFQTTTGRIVAKLPYSALSFNTPLDDSGRSTVTVPLTAPGLLGFDIRTRTTPWKYSVLVALGGRCQFIGVINDWPSYSVDDSGGSIEIPAAELWCLLKARPLIANYSTVGINGEPPADLTINGGTLADIAVSAVLQAQNMAGGGFPLDAPAVAVGDEATRTYEGSQITTASDALKNLSDAIGGPDIRFDGRLSADHQTATWVMRVG